MAIVNAEIRFTPKDAAWVTANAATVFQSGEIIYRETDGKYVLPDGVTALSGLTWYGGVSSGEVYNVLEYGLTGDGVTNDYTALNTLLNTTAPSGSTIYFPKGTYLLNSGISISNKQFYFIGDFATISVSGNFSAFTFTSTSNITLLASKNSFQNLLFLGTSTGASQNAIKFSQDASIFTVQNCTFTNFGGAGIIVYITNAAAGAGGLITTCKFIGNNVGIDSQLAGEYINIIGNYFLSNTQPIQTIAGNIKIIGNNINRNTHGIKIYSGSNDSHGIVSNNDINHCGFALDIDSIVNGMTISNNHIYSSNVSIVSATGVTISDSELDVSTYTLTNNTGLCFNNCTFVGTLGTTNVTGTAPVYVNCKDMSGNIKFTPAAASTLTGQIRRVSFALNSSTTLQTFAASTSYYISPLYSTVGSRSIVNQIVYKIGKRCKLIGYSINTASNSNPSQETSTVYLRLNNTTDVTLNSGVKWNASAWTTNTYSDFTLNQDILSTDSWEIKISTGAFTTAPTNGFIAVTLHFSEDF